MYRNAEQLSRHQPLPGEAQRDVGEIGDAVAALDPKASPFSARKIWSMEQAKPCDRLIERYRGSGDKRALHSLVKAIVIKADAEKDGGTKFELYTATLDRH